MRNFFLLFSGMLVTAAASASALELPAELVPVEVATGYSSLEGPAWSDHEQCLYFSSQDRPFGLHRYVPGEGASLFVSYESKVNGNVVLADGSLVTCESGNRRMVRRTLDGTFEVLADGFEGEPFNQPNDVVATRDGTIWFTTPNWPANAGEFVYAHDLESGKTRRAVGGVKQPNGLGFSPDEAWFYLMDNGDNCLLRYAVGPDGSIGEQEVLRESFGGGPDGMTLDYLGNIYACIFHEKNVESGVNILAPDGAQLARIPVPGNTTNLTFGGAHRQHLFITSGGTLYTIDLSEVYPISIPEVEIECTPDEVKLEWDSVPGQLYWIEVSEDMETWERLPESVPAFSDAGRIAHTLPNDGRRFYRVHPVWNH